jgi:ribosomal protein S18 acetylase RimI-like enzyme
MDVVRLAIPKRAALDEVLRLLEPERFDLAVIRCHASDRRMAAGLALSRPVTWHADTLVYFDAGASLTGPRPTTGAGTGLVELAATDAATLHAHVLRVFAGYQNHYDANPMLPPGMASVGYAEWATSHLSGPDRAAFGLVGAGHQLVGHACVTQHGARAEISLAGIEEQWRGLGHYRQLLSSLGHELAHRGVRELVISTQVDNGDAIRAWLRLGFDYVGSVATLHCMPDLPLSEHLFARTHAAHSERVQTRPPMNESQA